MGMEGRAKIILRFALKLINMLTLIMYLTTKSRQKKAALKKVEKDVAKEQNIAGGCNNVKRVNYEGIIKENKKFETYYKLQNIIPESDWDTFMSTNRVSLPAAFRVTGSRSQAEALTHLIQYKFVQDVIQLNTAPDAVETKFEVFPLPWYPYNLAWQMNLTRQDIRKTEAYCRLHNFLMSETESGNISRQETVSMIPPLALNVEPHHKVLDMCAAPGSKTAQIIEFLHGDESKIPEGIVVANDIENRRCYMLVHQAKRLQSPSLMITNHDASEYPDIFHTNQEGKLTPLKFDRVLCDVPCSGDGTIRKNVNLWRKWNPGNAIQLHSTQYRIVKRGLELLEVDGQLVYSTCSLNPIENEAVVHRILKECEGLVELQDINLSGLKYSPGISTWTPMGKDMTPYATFNEIPDKGKSALRESHFPPSIEDLHKYPFEKCIRVLPHQQNTGGFFIARFKKTKALPWEIPILAEDRKALGTIPRNNDGKADKKVPKLQGFNEDPYIFMSEEDSIWKPLREFYKLDASVEASSFLTRSIGDRRKNIYFTTKLVKNLVQANDSYVKIINTGVKAFARCDNKWSPCDYRLANEGLLSLLPYVQSRVVKIPKADLVILLLNVEADTPPHIATLSDATQIAVKYLERGSFILKVDCKIEDGGPDFTIELIGWRGNASIRAYVALNERIHYLRMCGEDVSKFEKNKYKDVSSIENGTPACPSSPSASTTIRIAEDANSGAIEVD